MLINKLAIIGVGLIGGSLARALKTAGECNTVSGYGRSQENLKKAMEMGVIDDFSDDISKVVLNADVIVLATPLMAYGVLLKKISEYMKPGAVITDVGSVKACVVDEAKSSLGQSYKHFIPGHPIAGKEQSGVTASIPDLFEDHMVILTPIPENSEEDIKLISSMWEICGANVVTMTVEHHDMVLAATSHLPHVLAYALVACLAVKGEQEDIFKYSAGGFRDFTRIASSSPEMWGDICVSNNQNLLLMIERYKQQLDAISELIQKQDKKALEELFSQVKDTRDQLIVPASTEKH